MSGPLLLPGAKGIKATKLVQDSMNISSCLDTHYSINANEVAMHLHRYYDALVEYCHTSRFIATEMECDMGIVVQDMCSIRSQSFPRSRLVS